MTNVVVGGSWVQSLLLAPLMVSSFDIPNSIYLIRGHRVMLSHDLARLYEVEPKVLNQSVKRNFERFPADFMFQLSAQEFANLKSQFVTSSWGGSRKPPYAFTEQGIAMLSGVIKSQRAIRVNIEIMRAFIQIRKYLISHSELATKLAKLESRYDRQFKVVFDALREIMEPPLVAKRKIGIISDPE